MEQLEKSYSNNLPKFQMKIRTGKIIYVTWALAVIAATCFASCKKLVFERITDASTDSVSITGTTVMVYGTVLDLGKKPIIRHGHCWSTSENPDTTDFKSDLGTFEGTGIFYSRLRSIKPGKLHYARSYIYDGTNVIYGQQISFKVESKHLKFSAPQVDKLGPTLIRTTSVIEGIGSVDFEDHGHCWSQNDPPTINDNLSRLGKYNSEIPFSSLIDELNSGRYFIRGYMRDGNDIVYSDTKVYESSLLVETRVININSSESITANSEIISLGINQITDHGHCYSRTTSNPNYNSNRTSLGAKLQPGPFQETISNLNAGSKYYIRAYATDGKNVYYGDIRTFDAN
jgi:hypothetical protein